VFKKFDALQAADHFCLNMIVSLSIYRSLKRFKVPDLHIKWPNDILSGDLKMCGILIETLMAGNKVKSAVVGIGLNVNQTSFPKTINATSLKSIFKKSYDLNNLLELLVADLKKAFLGSENFDWHSIQQAYEDQLYKKGQLSSFVDANGQKSKGIIRGISKTGKLVIEFDMKPQEFDLKEIKMVLD